jgi:hypothetical protein
MVLGFAPASRLTRRPVDGVCARHSVDLVRLVRGHAWASLRVLGAVSSDRSGTRRPRRSTPRPATETFTQQELEAVR